MIELIDKNSFMSILLAIIFFIYLLSGLAIAKTIDKLQENKEKYLKKPQIYIYVCIPLFWIFIYFFKKYKRHD